MGPLDNITWKEYFLIGGLLIIWAITGFFGFNAIINEDATKAGFGILIGVVSTGVLLILIAIIDRVF